MGQAESKEIRSMHSKTAKAWQKKKRRMKERESDV